MTVIATLEMRFKPESVADARDLFAGELVRTREFDGCHGVEVLVDVNDAAHWVAHETWESMEHDAAYREFRAGPGKIEGLGPMLAAAPVLTHFEVDPAV